MTARARPAPAVEIRIEELRLEGFEPRHRLRIAEALQRELERLVRAKIDGQGFTPPADASRLDGGSFAFGPHDSPDRVGREIARATFRGLAPAPRRTPPDAE